jgi:hypothetical protein
MTKEYKPGEKAPVSGQYQEVGPRGGKVKEITAIKGHPLPPPEKKGSSFIIADRTKNKSGR